MCCFLPEEFVKILCGSYTYFRRFFFFFFLVLSEHPIAKGKNAQMQEADPENI